MKAININFQGAEYALTFNRKSIELMEQSGFVIRDLESKPITMLPRLFAGAFKAKHADVSADTINAIYEGIANKGALVSKLVELFQEPVLALIGDSEVTPEKNVTWEANW